MGWLFFSEERCAVQKFSQIYRKIVLVIVNRSVVTLTRILQWWIFSSAELVSSTRFCPIRWYCDVNAYLRSLETRSTSPSVAAPPPPSCFSSSVECWRRATERNLYRYARMSVSLIIWPLRCVRKVSS